MTCRNLAQWSMRPALLTFVVVTFSALPARNAVADDVSTSVAASKTSVQIAEPFDIELVVKAPAGTRVSFPDVLSQFGEFEVLGHTDAFDIPDKVDPRTRTWTRRMSLESLVTGELVIPSLEIVYISGSSQRTVRTGEKQIRVVSVLENQSDPMNFRDIKSVIDIDVPERISYAWLGLLVGGTCGLAAFAFIVARFVSRKKRLSPRQWATSELNLLLRSKPFGEGDAKFVFDRLEAIIRSFLEHQFGIPATRLTVDELLATLSGRKNSDLTLGNPIAETRDDPTNDRLLTIESIGSETLARLLRTAEQAKYAGRQFSVAELNLAIGDALEVIDRFRNTAFESPGVGLATPNANEKSQEIR